MTSKTFGLILAVCFFSAGACFANPFMGEWKLDEAKSKLGHGAGKNMTVTYEWQFPFKTKVMVDGIDSHGHPYHSQWMGAFDGKDYPVTGDMTSDARSYTKVNENTLDFVSKKGGAVVGGGRIAVSADEHTRTVTSWSTNAHGNKVKSIAVYHRH